MGFFFLHPWILIMAFEFVWIGQVLRRLSKDMGEWRRSESLVHKSVILTIWLITAGMIAHVSVCLFRLGSFFLAVLL